MKNEENVLNKNLINAKTKKIKGRFDIASTKTENDEAGNSDRLIQERYRILGKAGEGGSAEIFLVWDRRLMKKWIMKKIKQDLISDSLFDSISAYSREIEILKDLKCEGIPYLVDAFVEGNSLCLVMEYMEGVSLKQYIFEHGVLMEKSAVRVFLKLAEMIAYLHQLDMPVIHGDIKPENIICINGLDEIALLDFGAASLFCEKGAGENKAVFGTCGYIAPEIYDGASPSCLSDIYSFGRLMLYVLKGEEAQRTNEFITGSGLFERVPAVERLVQRCIQIRPDNRPQSMAEIIEFLRRKYKVNLTNKENMVKNIHKTQLSMYYKIKTVLLTEGKTGIERIERRDNDAIRI